MKKISVILPVYNEEAYLAYCLDSICSQTLKEIEIICIDDGSTDSSLEILHTYQQKDGRIRVLTQENRYAGAARNRGMKEACGEYLVFLDGDDYFEPEMLETMYQRAKETEADAVICGYRELDQETRELYRPDRSFEDLFFREKRCFRGDGLYCAGLFQITRGWAWDKLFRTDFVKDCGYEFPEFRSSEDGFFVYLLLARAEKLSYMDEILVTHRIRVAASLSATRDRDWINGFRMWQLIRAELERLGIYTVYEQSFLNELVYFILWYMESLHTQEAFEACRDYLRQQGEPYFGILAYDREKYFSEEVLDWYQELMDGSV